MRAENADNNGGNFTPASPLNSPVSDSKDKAASAKQRICPVAFCADANYGAYLPVVAQSIARHASPNYHYRIIVLDCGITPDALTVLRRQIAGLANFSLTVENISENLNAHKDAFQEKWHLTRAMYGRLFIPQLCGQYDRVIYSDIDVVFNRDIAELMEINLGDNYIAAVPDPRTEMHRKRDSEKQAYLEKTLGLAPDMPAIYSGLLVFNIAEWRDKHLSDAAIKFITENKLMLPDQDAIAHICRGRTFYLAQIWTCVVLRGEMEEEASKLNAGKYPAVAALLNDWRAACIADNSVLHWSGPSKPWNSPFTFRGGEWWDYAGQTEWHQRYAYELAQRSALLSSGFTENGNWTKEYSLFGLPLLTIRKYLHNIFYMLFGIRVAKVKRSKNCADIYLFGIKCVSKRYKGC